MAKKDIEKDKSMFIPLFFFPQEPVDLAGPITVLAVELLQPC